MEEKTINEAKQIFIELIEHPYVNKELPIINTLIEFNYLKKEEGWIRFTERALVQFSDFICSFNGRFKKCKLCGFLGEEKFDLTENEYHTECLKSVKV